MFIRAAIAALGLTACVAAPGGAIKNQPSAQIRSPSDPALDAIAANAVATGFPATLIGVQTRNGAVKFGAAGRANRDTDTPAQPGELFHAASTTKTVTAAAVFILVDRGALGLDDKIASFLPTETLSNIPYADEMTVRQLLRHESGLYSPNNDPVYVQRYIGPERLTKPFWTPEEIVAFAANPANEPYFKPGEGQEYGDVNYVLLSMIVSHRSGTSFKDFVREEIFSPLDMADAFYLSDDPGRDRMTGYTVDSDLLRQFGMDATNVDEDGFIPSNSMQEQSDGGAGIVWSMKDMTTFARAIIDGDLLSEQSRAFLLDVLNFEEGQDSALGVLRAYRKDYGKIAAAEGDGPGTNVAWVYHEASGAIIGVSVSQFGGWNENDYIFETIVPAVLNDLAED